MVIKTIVVPVPGVSCCCCCHHCHCHRPAEVRIEVSPRIRGPVERHEWSIVRETNYGRAESGSLNVGGSYEVLEVSEEGVVLKYHICGAQYGARLRSGAVVFLTLERFTAMSGGLVLKPGAEKELCVRDVVVRISDRSCCHHCHCHGHAHCCEPAEVQIVPSCQGFSGRIKNSVEGIVLKSSHNHHGYWHYAGEKGFLLEGERYEVLRVSNKGVDVRYIADGDGGVSLAKNARIFLTHEEFTKMSGGLSLRLNEELNPCTHEMIIRFQH